jgi:hypothetical protein
VSPSRFIPCNLNTKKSLQRGWAPLEALFGLKII